MVSGNPVIRCIDIESTGIDVENDRIVTFFYGEMRVDGSWVKRKNWVIDPGIEIPKEASDVHKMTTEWVRKRGSDPKTAIGEILDMMQSSDLPVVIYNAPFDTSMLDREAQRYGYAWAPTWDKVIDPLVIDRTIDKFRKGPRKLVNVAANYGVEVDESKAHDASYDCYLAGNIAIKMRPTLRSLAPESTRSDQGAYMEWLQKWQRASYANWAAGFEKYLRSSGKEPEAVIKQDWPMVPRA